MLKKLALVVGMLVVAGCSGDVVNPAPMEIVPQIIHLKVGDTQSFTVYGGYEGSVYQFFIDYPEYGDLAKTANNVGVFTARKLARGCTTTSNGICVEYGKYFPISLKVASVPAGYTHSSQSVTATIYIDQE